MTNAIALDPESAEWLRELQPGDAARDDAVSRLHAAAPSDGARRGSGAARALPARALDELDHLCVEAASDALMAILAKLESYRGAARFTTWACKFAILETSSRFRRLAWRNRKVEIDESIWDRLPDAAPPALQASSSGQLLAALPARSTSSSPSGSG